ncbi:MAG: hypothetical protein GTN75_01565 [Gemmatimonadetes bacterium]|nr:hypothetical protein [Gemmatimonadota bacterium]
MATTATRPDGPGCYFDELEREAWAHASRVDASRVDVRTYGIDLLNVLLARRNVAAIEGIRNEAHRLVETVEGLRDELAATRQALRSAIIRGL